MCRYLPSIFALVGGIGQRVEMGAIVDHSRERIAQAVCVVESLTASLLGELLHGGMTSIAIRVAGTQFIDRVLHRHVSPLLTDLPVVDLKCAVRDESLGGDWIKCNMRSGQQVCGFSDAFLEINRSAEWIDQV